MSQQPFDLTPSPAPSLSAGDRVRLAADFGDYDGWNHLPAGTEGVVLGYATPELKKNQRWTDESYFVRLDRDRPDSHGRVFARQRLARVTGAPALR